MIQVTDFVKQYGDFTAVDGLTFHVPTGAVAAMVGPNGAGKTTTIRTLCGILKPTSGELLVGNASVTRHALEVKRRTAYVPDDPPLFDALTVWEHLRFIAAAYQLEPWQDAAQRWLARFQLEEKQHVAAAELSRGMRQKVAIACAYLRQPDVLLLDEPMTGLDPPSIRTLKTTIREQSARGATVLVSSHLLDLVEDLCSHLIVMRKGKTLFDDSLAAARERIGNSASSLEDVFFHLAGDGDESAPNRELPPSASPRESSTEDG